MALITKAQLKDYLPGVTGTGNDALLDELIARTDALVAAWLGYPVADGATDPSIEAATYTLFLRGPGGRKLPIPIGPLNSITSIEDDPDEDFDGSTELVAAGDYSIRDFQIGYQPTVLLKTDSSHGVWSFTDEARPIKVVCNAGWTTVPKALEHTALMVATHLWKQRSTLGRQQVSGPSGVIVSPLGEDIPPSAWTYAAPYRLWWRWTGE